MFKVVAATTKPGDIQQPYNVYAVRSRPSITPTQVDTLFLFYEQGKWVWKMAEYFMPPFRLRTGPTIGLQPDHYQEL
jgi:hypothetical protein